MYVVVYLLYMCHYEYITCVKCTIIPTITLLMTTIYKIITFVSVMIFTTLPVGACRDSSLCRILPHQQKKLYNEAREIYIEVFTGTTPINIGSEGSLHQQVCVCLPVFASLSGRTCFVARLCEAGPCMPGRCQLSAEVWEVVVGM